MRLRTLILMGGSALILAGCGLRGDCLLYTSPEPTRH